MDVSRKDAEENAESNFVKRQFFFFIIFLLLLFTYFMIRLIRDIRSLPDLPEVLLLFEVDFDNDYGNKF